MSIRKSYIDGPFGQIHLRTIGERGHGAAAKPDLICLHPAPFSGLAFTAIMPHLAKGRRVIAPDFPGHGGSDPFRADASIADYAAAMLTAADMLSPGAPVDLFGFHSGGLVAVEMGIAAPARINQLVLCDTPAFDAATRAGLLETNARAPGFTPDLNSLGEVWARGVERRVESQGMARSLEMFTEQLRHGEAMNGGFHAAFSYDVERQLVRLTRPATMIATRSGLLDATRRAASLIPDAALVERLDVTRAVIDEAAETIAGEVLRALGD
ncbi:MAG: alpha/beta fold hydrolase [Pacificimonas sp.]|nr:alpha/beta fold hydrolase [Pacificimonas sp.]